jgi:CRP/FNR family nitrogen fixation transcriptional regulator
MALEETRRLQNLILILGRTTAQEKVGAFLVHLAERLAGGPADHMILPISRYDIADYLALSVETVSRALTSLKRSGLIKFAGTRQVAMINRDAMEASSAFGRIGPGVERERIPGSDAGIFDAAAFSSSRAVRGGGR